MVNATDRLSAYIDVSEDLFLFLDIMDITGRNDDLILSQSFIDDIFQIGFKSFLIK